MSDSFNPSASQDWVLFEVLEHGAHQIRLIDPSLDDIVWVTKWFKESAVKVRKHNHTLFSKVKFNQILRSYLNEKIE